MNAVFRATKYAVWFTSHREKHERRLSAMGRTGVAAARVSRCRAIAPSYRRAISTAISSRLA